ncbi:MAG: hypothetical protein C0395_09125 [Gemmatimonas sp.]|nr:hypothetical protein [Gemmatimonas sp.]
MSRSTLWLLALCAAASMLFVACGGDDSPSNPPPPAGTTALVGDDGGETTSFDSFEQVSLSLAELEPNTIYTIEVSDAAKTLLGRYELTTDGNGEMDASSVIYDPEPGDYDVDVLGTSISFTLTVNEPTAFWGMPCDETGVHANNYDVGDMVYFTMGNGTADAEVDIYVVPNRYDWAAGMYLFDYTESVERVVLDAEGELAPTAIWQSAGNEESVSYDVIVDVDRDGVYSAGDYLDGQIGVGFVVQETDVAKTLIDGHVVERLSADDNYVYRDVFNTNENVYVYLNPVARMRNLGGDRYVNWYIVPHQELWEDGDPLDPVTTPIGDTVQYGCTNAGRRLLWPSPLAAGQYDIVIDVDGDEIYDMGQDILDGYSGQGNWVGFTVQAPPATRDWTLLVYADGEGGLSASRSAYAAEISGAINANMYAAVLFDGDNGAGYTDCKRYICNPGAAVEDADYPDDLNMGHPLTLHDFLTWGIAKFPARKYMIVLSNHGGSWFGEDHAVPNELWYEGAKAMCYDGGDALNMYELQAVYRDIKAMVGEKLDVVWYQGCLMGGVEVAAISKDYFDYMVSHETVRFGSENNGKFPAVVQTLIGNAGAAAAATKCVDGPTAPNTTYSATYELSKYGALESSLRTFVDQALGHEDFDGFKVNLMAILNATRRVRTVGDTSNLDPYEQNGDLPDFFDRVADVEGDDIPAAVKTAARAVANAGEQLVDTGMGNVGGDPGLNGVAIWLPRTPAEFNTYATEYSGFDFATNTRWLEFLGSLYGVAYRIELTWGAEPRDLDSHLYDAAGNHLAYHTPVIPTADLDTDDTSGYGPENVRIAFLAPGVRDHYEYLVRLYSGDGVNGSLSTVKVFRGGDPTPAATFYRTWNDSQRGWHVFNIMVEDGSIVPVEAVYPDIPNLLTAEPAK